MKTRTSIYTLLALIAFLLAMGQVTGFAESVGELLNARRWSNVYDAPGGTALNGVVLQPGARVKILNQSAEGHWVLVSTESEAGESNGWVPADAINTYDTPYDIPNDETELEQTAVPTEMPPIIAEVASPMISSVVVDRANQYEVRFKVSFEGMPRNGYKPMFYAFDPDNCLDCTNPEDIMQYEINGISILHEGHDSVGVTQVSAVFDGTYCAAEPRTTRFIMLLADGRPYLSGGNSIADDVVEIPFNHRWCQ